MSDPGFGVRVMIMPKFIINDGQDAHDIHTMCRLALEFAEKYPNRKLDQPVAWVHEWTKARPVSIRRDR